MLASFCELLAPTYRVDRPEVGVFDMAKLLVARLCDTPNNPSLVLAAAHEVGTARVEVQRPHCRCVAAEGELADPLIDGVFKRPRLDRVIVTCREKLVSIGMPLDKFDIL